MPVETFDKVKRGKMTMRCTEAQELLTGIRTKAVETITATQRDFLTQLGLIRTTILSLTDEGIRVSLALEAAASRLDKTELATFIIERRQLWDQIRDCLDKRGAVLAQLESVGFKTYDFRVLQFALSIAIMKDAPVKVWERARVLNDFLYQERWLSYDRLWTVTAVMRQDGNIEQLREKLMETLRIMIADYHSKNYSTLCEAANIMRLPDKKLQERYARFEALQQELGKRGRRVRSYISGYLAIQLGLRSGSPVELADRFRELEKAIVAEGYKDCVSSGVAADILFDKTGSNADKAKQFATTMEVIQRYGWKDDTSMYFVAAALSIMPGTTEENALLLSELCAYLNNDSTNNKDYHSTNLALRLLMFSYQRSKKENEYLPCLQSYIPSGEENSCSDYYNSGPLSDGGLASVGY